MSCIITLLQPIVVVNSVLKSLKYKVFFTLDAQSYAITASKQLAMSSQFLEKICPRFDARYSALGIGLVFVEASFRAKCFKGKPIAD
jgi:hypothetical protein